MRSHSASDTPLDVFHPMEERLRQDLAALRQPWVRDIAWLLHAPDMATVDYPGRPTLAELGLDHDDHRRAWLRRQESRESDFQAHRLKRRSQRLGIYHELLWHWILDHAPRTRLLAHNVALRDSGQTLGELDLLYTSDRVGDASPGPGGVEIFHAELAIKFFLGLPEGPGDEQDPSRWIGVGSFDSLAIKCHRLQSHQLPQGRSPVADRQRRALGADGPMHQRTIMPGCLYQPWDQRLSLPRLANDGAEQGLWCHRSDWHALSRQLPEGAAGHLLAKPHWLAPPATEPMPLAILDNELARHFDDLGKSAHLLLVLPDGRRCRVFVVSREWPPAMPLPPRNASPSAH
ncbi:DUF1853 family protein [Salinicola socius]|nr:DUF1853 family protein [Salinicola socius]